MECGNRLRVGVRANQTKKNSTAGRSSGGPSEKFVRGFGRHFQKLPRIFSEVAFMWKSPDAAHFGATSQKFASEPLDSSEVAPEVRPDVHKAALRPS